MCLCACTLDWQIPKGCTSWQCPVPVMWRKHLLAAAATALLLSSEATSWEQSYEQERSTNARLCNDPVTKQLNLMRATQAHNGFQRLPVF